MVGALTTLTTKRVSIHCTTSLIFFGITDLGSQKHYLIFIRERNSFRAIAVNIDIHVAFGNRFLCRMS